MFNIKSFIGKTLGELAEQTGVFWDIVHIFVLNGENDTTGYRLMDVYSIQQVLNAYPSAVSAMVVDANNCCRESFLRIRF